MDCEKARDRFSSLWEKELAPFEEKILKEHLASCPECLREFENFEKTMGWLHSVEEVEIPEGFLHELYKKRKEKKQGIPSEKSGERWLHFLLSFKLPAQAVAMVAIVFLVLYLTRMMPFDGGRLKETKQIPSAPSLEKKSETLLARNQAESERRALETPAETHRPKDVDQVRPPASAQGRPKEAFAPQLKTEAKETQVPAPSPQTFGDRAADSNEPAKGKPLSPEPRKIRGEAALREKSLVASKPSPEIVLKISDRRKVIPRLRELVKQFEGEVVATEGDRLIASLPTSSLLEFEKELAGFSSSGKADRLIGKKRATGSLRLEEGAKREEGEEKSKGSAGPAATTESRTIIRILLVEE